MAEDFRRWLAGRICSFANAVHDWLRDHALAVRLVPDPEILASLLDGRVGVRRADDSEIFGLLAADDDDAPGGVAGLATNGTKST